MEKMGTCTALRVPFFSQFTKMRSLYRQDCRHTSYISSQSLQAIKNSHLQKKANNQRKLEQRPENQQVSKHLDLAILVFFLPETLEIFSLTG